MTLRTPIGERDTGSGYGGSPRRPAILLGRSMATDPTPTAMALLAAAALAQAATPAELDDIAAAKAAELRAPTTL